MWFHALLLAALTNALPREKYTKPNFVVLFVDDMGIDQIRVPKSAGIYGYTGNNSTISTPSLAKLASEGLLFQTWYSSFHLCSPSRASMMTGELKLELGSLTTSRALGTRRQIESMQCPILPKPRVRV